jgi:spore coat polysaccharide biosynthesis protein SpsF
MGEATKPGEASRLEALWGGQFGDDYVERNRNAPDRREAFWNGFLDQFPSQRVLEVGCNLGGNLRWIARRLPPAQVFGIDVNQKALEQLRAATSVNAVHATARDLPFRDRWFDLVFTMGVLIHQPPETLPLVMAEIVRTSRRWVLCGEYFSEAPTEVAYRGQTGALFKRDYGDLYQRLFPELTLRKKGFLSQADGWDDVTWWVFEKA